MIIGVGIDTVLTSRFEQHLTRKNQALLDRLFTPEEQAYCLGKATAADCLAARFAVKEAFLKALGTGLRNGVSWCEMSVIHDELGKPLLIVSGAAANVMAQRGATNIHLSISHDGGHAVALVVLEGS
ncbi:MAG: holo-ACP synthase [Trichlorobacter sp.]|jgi:holo-[acyl-carrier protein] synthase